MRLSGSRHCLETPARAVVSDIRGGATRERLVLAPLLDAAQSNQTGGVWRWRWRRKEKREKREAGAHQSAHTPGQITTMILTPAASGATEQLSFLRIPQELLPPAVLFVRRHRGLFSSTRKGSPLLVCSAGSCRSLKPSPDPAPSAGSAPPI